MRFFRLLVLVFLTAQVALALPLPTKEKLSRISYSALINKKGDYSFNGILGLNNCSASLVRFEHSQPHEPAMMLTNGHCYEGGLIRPNQYVFGRASNRRVFIYNDDGYRLGEVRASMVLYATMTGTDMALYRLDRSFQEIETEFAVQALTLSSQPRPIGTAIQVVSGYWLKGYTCAIEKVIPRLQESNWYFSESLRYSRPGCEVIPGTSGSPIIEKDTRTVVGVNNTGNEDGEACTMDNPCEHQEDGTVHYQKGYSYGQQTYWIYSCLNSGGEIDLAVQGCLLHH